MFWLVVAIAISSLLDGLMTRKIINHYGVEIELNWIIQKLWKYNHTAAIALGITIPRALIVGLAVLFHKPVILAVLLGLMLLYQWKQVRTHWNLL